MKRAQTIIWVILALLTLFTAVNALTGGIVYRIILRWALVGISLTAGSCIVYHFVRVFYEKHPKRKMICGAITVIVVMICFGIYYLDHRPPKVVQMREDTLYISPKNDIK
jgi:hypothetical protein